jgi:hypothetical protein
VEWFLQVLSFNECFYEHRDSSDFIAFLDIDDVLFPRYYDSLPEELYALSAFNPNVASFEFQWELISTRIGQYLLIYRVILFSIKSA